MSNLLPKETNEAILLYRKKFRNYNKGFKKFNKQRLKNIRINIHKFRHRHIFKLNARVRNPILIPE